LTFARPIVKIRIGRGGEVIEKKMGRPTNNPKTVRLGLRLTPDEAEMLFYCSEMLKVARINVIVKGIELVKAQIDQKE